jgi:prepilin-type N-terminal cleavage/methylation domain-containing protein
MKNTKQSGYSLIEVMVASAIMGVVTYGITTAMTQFKRAEYKTLGALEESIDTLSGEAVMLIDFKNVEVSFNQLKLQDDNLHNFFDFYSDLPALYVKPTAERKLTLKLSGNKEFILMRTQDAKGSMMLYDPPLAYNIGAAPANVNVAATLNYISINKDKAIEKERPQFWKDNQYIFLDTPVQVRQLVNGAYNMQVPSRSPAFLGQVQAQDLRRDSSMSQYLTLTHPGTGAPINSVDNFLRSIPSMGGGQNFVRARAVDFIKYRLEKDTNSKLPNAARLIRSIVVNGTESSPFLVAEDVESIEFLRTSVCEKVIRYSITKLRKN